MELTACGTDDDYEAWRSVRMAVHPGERCPTVAELRAQDSPDRVLLIATEDGTVLGSGLAQRSETAGGGAAAPRVLPEHRRRGVGTALLRALADHCTRLGLPELRSAADDEGSLAFATRFGFVEVDREVEQVRTVGDEPVPPPPPAGVRLVTLDEQPGRWAACFDTFGSEVLADFALYAPLDISLDQWTSDGWAGDPTFLALSDGEVVGCAGLNRDADRPERAEHSLTGVRRDWRGRGLAEHLKRHTLRWAAQHGVHELYTWTQAGNAAMIRLNEKLGYAVATTSITVARPLPL